MKAITCSLATLFSLVIAFSLVLAGSLHATTPSIDWIRQLGTSGSDISYGVSADPQGNVYIAGQTSGKLGGPTAGGIDAFVSKYHASGVLLWTEQLGTTSDDSSFGVSADSQGNVYITGRTNGSLDGTNAGISDAFVSKYDTTGMLLWTEQLGTSGVDESFGVSADLLGNVYISGTTQGSLGGPIGGTTDAFVSKYSEAGTHLWTKQLGTSLPDSSAGVSADSLGNVYIAGKTNGGLGGPSAGISDAFVSKYDATGGLLWTKQLGTISSDSGTGVSADSLGNVYITGTTNGSLGGPSAGSSDAFVRKYDASGGLLWTKQLGSSSSDQSLGVAADSLGNVYITGWTSGSLDGPNAGNSDAFVSKYGATGTLHWTEQIGTGGFDISRGVFADSLGNIYISGETRGSLGDTNAGSDDVFLVKLSDPPLFGDFDDDGDVDGGDFLDWQRNDGTAVNLALWQSDYGAGAVLASAASVPEPSSLAFATLCGIFSVAVGGRRRSR